MLATGLALVILLGVVAALVTRLVVTPVRVAARTAQRLSAGLLDQRMKVDGEDDLALLAASFNQMAANLQRQIVRLEEMSRLQRRFTSDVSHELRTPLTTVRMAADLIFAERDDFDPAVARSAELLQAELDRFESLLTDLLEISRFDAGFAALDAEHTDLVPIVRTRRRTPGRPGRAGRRHARAAPAGRPGDRRGGPAPGRADPAQPGRQRRRARRGPARRGHPGQRRRGRRGHRPGPRGRAQARRGAAGLQPVLAGRPVPGPADRRHRARPVHQRRGRPAARRLAGGLGRAGRGRAVPAHPAGAGR